MGELSGALALVAMLMLGGGVALCLPQEETRRQAGERLVRLGSLVLLASLVDDPQVLVPLVLTWANLACLSWGRQEDGPRVPAGVPIALAVAVLLIVAWDPYLGASEVAWACAVFAAVLGVALWLIKRVDLWDDEDDESDEAGETGRGAGADPGRLSDTIAGNPGTKRATDADGDADARGESPDAPE